MPHVVALLCGLSILVGQFFYGGLFRPVFVYPSYLILAGAAFISVAYLIVRKPDTPKPLCVGLMVMFVLWMLFRSSVAVGLPQASELSQLILGSFLIYLMLAYVVVSSESRLLFLLVVLAGALVQAAVAGGQFFGVWGGQPQGWMSEQLRVWYDKGDAPNVYRRAHGFYINGNHLVWLLNAGGLFALAMGAFGRGKAVAKVLWIYVGAVCLAISLACLSRGGMLALGGGLLGAFILSLVAVLYAAPDRRIASLAGVLGAFAIPVGLVLLILSQNASVLARATLLFEEAYRPQVWMAAIREFQLFPWGGAGPGAFAYYARSFRLGSANTDDYFAHNDWLQLAADYGFVAVFLILLIVVVHLTRGCRGYLRILRGRVTSLIPQSNSAALIVGAVTVVLAFLIHSFFDFNMQLPANALLGAACLGMLASTSQGRAFGEGGRFHAVLRQSGPLLLGGATIWLLVILWLDRSEFSRLKAENYMLTGEYGIAWQIAEEAAQQDEHSSALQYIGGVSLQRASTQVRDKNKQDEMLETAIGSLREAVRLAPNDRSANIELARSLMMANKLGEAKKVAFEVIRLEPRQVTGYELYGSILEAEGNPYAARRVYQLGAAVLNTEFLRERLRVLGENVEGLP